jgi:myotubularin-related protein 9
VDFVEKRITPEKNVIILKCKDFVVYNLTLPTQEDATNISNSIETLSTLTNVTLHYPYFCAKSSLEEREHVMYSVEKELATLPKGYWRLSDVNANYKVCSTYPPQLIVPSNITDQMILRSSDFREGGRFPVVSYVHSNNTILLRSSQPLTGSNSRRCKEDEKIINTVLKPGQRGYIIDARSQQITQQAKSKGGGSESEYNYPQWKKIYQNIHRFHVQQESYVKFVESCIEQNIVLING